MSTPGAGVDHKKVVRVSKRMRNLHRKANSGVSLRSWAQYHAWKTDSENHSLAASWIDLKAGSK